LAFITIEENEVEAMESERDGKEGLMLDSPNVVCGSWTNRVVEVGAMTEAKFETSRDTRRCVVLYKPVGTCTSMKLTCKKFYVDNRDPVMCKRGDVFITKSGETQPRRFCKRDGPTNNFPAMAPDSTNLRAWYVNDIGLNDYGRYPSKGVKCFVCCSSPGGTCPM